eukprot:CAMPEP_0198296138 /NCGR_PEP_ID=MMETSP1449-20131203/31120_1 /TAXON_ID=420275 /ORGANISM="Attheya septentrionalis, Strain CCMP2084" /LENGTH=878 /DNA_ID=CAMNT_0043996659 /DNA_START=141 /DNA_END=2777 /DNA_ORIENTATION=-
MSSRASMWLLIMLLVCLCGEETAFAFRMQQTNRPRDAAMEDKTPESQSNRMDGSSYQEKANTNRVPPSPPQEEEQPIDSSNNASQQDHTIPRKEPIEEPKIEIPSTKNPPTASYSYTTSFADDNDDEDDQIMDLDEQDAVIESQKVTAEDHATIPEETVQLDDEPEAPNHQHGQHSSISNHDTYISSNSENAGSSEAMGDINDNGMGKASKEGGNSADIIDDDEQQTVEEQVQSETSIGDESLSLKGDEDTMGEAGTLIDTPQTTEDIETEEEKKDEDSMCNNKILSDALATKEADAIREKALLELAEQLKSMAESINEIGRGIQELKKVAQPDIPHDNVVTEDRVSTDDHNNDDDIEEEENEDLAEGTVITDLDDSLHEISEEVQLIEEILAEFADIPDVNLTVPEMDSEEFENETLLDLDPSVSVDVEAALLEEAMETVEFEENDEVGEMNDSEKSDLETPVLSDDVPTDSTQSIEDTIDSSDTMAEPSLPSTEDAFNEPLASDSETGDEMMIEDDATKDDNDFSPDIKELSDTETSESARELETNVNLDEGDDSSSTDGGKEEPTFQDENELASADDDATMVLEEEHLVKNGLIELEGVDDDSITLLTGEATPLDDNELENLDDDSSILIEDETALQEDNEFEGVDVSGIEEAGESNESPTTVLHEPDVMGDTDSLEDLSSYQGQDEKETMLKIDTKVDTQIYNREFVEGLDDLHKLMEEVDPPDEMDVGAAGSSIQEVLMGQGTKIISKRLSQEASKAKTLASVMGKRVRKKWDKLVRHEGSNEKTKFGEVCSTAVKIIRESRHRVVDGTNNLWKPIISQWKQLSGLFDKLLGGEDDEDEEEDFEFGANMFETTRLEAMDKIKQNIRSSTESLD